MAKKSLGETSYKDTALGIIPRSQLVPLEIEGIKKAWDFVLQKKQSGKIPLTPAFFKKTHKIGFGWIFPQIGGNYRGVEVRVSQHRPPKFFQIPSMMLDFSRDLKTRLKHLPDINESIDLEK